MEVELDLADLPRLMSDVASAAAHVEGRVPATFLRNVDAGFVATKAEAVLLVPRFGLQQLILVVRCVGIVTLEAVPHRRGVNLTLYIGGIFVRVARQTERIGGRRNQLDVGCVSVVANLVAAAATHGNRRMHRLTLCLIVVTRNTGRGIRLGIEWDGMPRRKSGRGEPPWYA